MLNFCRRTDKRPAPARRNGELESLREEEQRVVVAETDLMDRRVRDTFDSIAALTLGSAQSTTTMFDPGSVHLKPVHQFTYYYFQQHSRLLAAQHADQSRVTILL